MRREVQIGILAVALSIVLKRFAAIPEFIMGILLGLGIGLEIVGILPEKTYGKLKEWKKTIVGSGRV